MLTKESLSLLFVLIATACALKCYQQATVRCGEHDAQYESVCSQVEQMTTDRIEVTCEDGFDRCGSGEMIYSLTGLEMAAKFASCATGETGCEKNVKESIADQLESAPAIPSGSLPGLSIETKDICRCEEDLCNSTLSKAGSISVLLLSVLLALFI